MSLNSTTLTNAIDANVTQFAVGSTSNITAPNFQTGSGITFLYMGQEMMQVTGVPLSGVVQVVRGFNGTRATSHGASEPIIIGLPSDFANFTPSVGSFVVENNRFFGVSAPVAAAATITPTGKLFHITGTTATSKINLPSVDTVEGQFTVIADATWTWTSATTPLAIAQSGTVTALSSSVTFTYDAATQLWYPSRVA